MREERKGHGANKIEKKNERRESEWIRTCVLLYTYKKERKDNTSILHIS